MALSAALSHSHFKVFCNCRRMNERFTKRSAYKHAMYVVQDILHILLFSICHFTLVFNLQKTDIG